MKRYASISILSVCLSAAAVLGVEAETEPYQELTAKPVHVAMFKNGLAMIVARAELPQGQGAYRLSPLPEATFGSLWISWPEGLELSDIRALTTERTELVRKAIS